MEKVKALFLVIYRATRSVEVAILELKRKGCSQQQTAEAIAQVFGIDLTFAQQAVHQSLAWQPGDGQPHQTPSP